MIALVHTVQVMDIGDRPNVRCRISTELEGTMDEIEASIMVMKLSGDVAGFQIWDFWDRQEYNECCNDWRIMQRRLVKQWWDKRAIAGTSSHPMTRR